MKMWSFCRGCQWQADQPYDSSDTARAFGADRARGLLCPRCRATVVLVEFDRKIWMKVGADLLSGSKRVADYVPAPTPRTARRDWEEPTE